MSKEIRMALVVNFFSVLFSIVLARPDQSMGSPRSFKISGNVTYDCIDIYKQPSLNHPLLKTHQIQMKPTISRSEMRNPTYNNMPSYKESKGCPSGTVPILRNMKELIINSQNITDKYVHPLSAESPGIHVAGVRSRNGPFHGVEAYFDGHNLNISKGQASYTQIYVATSGLNNHLNFISAGFMINPNFYPDARVWIFGFWKGKNGKGCYNTACNGFVQVSKKIPIVEPIDPIYLSPGKPTFLHYSIHQDKITGNWWLTSLSSKTSIVDIGYWPKELFDLFDNGASMVGVGSEVHGSHSGLSPPMGNGNFPYGDRKGSSMFTNIEVLDSKYKQRKMNYFSIEKLLDSPQCYGLKIHKLPYLRLDNLGFNFNYGGPGGSLCGI